MVGRIGRAHGIRGEVSVQPHTDEPNVRFAVGSVLRASPSSHHTLTVETVRPHGERLLVSFAEIADRTAAESLRGASLVVDVAAGERPTDPDEFYDHQLVGLVVRTRAGRHVGIVNGVLHLPAQDVLEVALQPGGDRALVPFVTALVPRVDLESGEIVVEDVPGLLDSAPVEG